MTDEDADDTLPGPVAAVVREAMAKYQGDPERGDFMLEYACSQSVDPLPLYRVLYKFYNRQRRFDRAYDYAGRALAGAADLCNLTGPPEAWARRHLAGADPMLASQVLLALKALSFISLRRGDEAGSERYLTTLSRLDPEDGSGVSVVTALAESVRKAR
ncbi:MAG: hypothetical protein PHR30_09975 [Gallionellaceae bacterium]|nr:hypothetical protein [Gallionellaceae bacterium]